MWHRIKDLWAHNRYLLLAFIAALGIAGFFGVRSVSEFIYWSDPAHRDQPLAGWMTPRYVARSYRLPREVVQTAFNIDTGGQGRRVSLYSLAAETGMTLDQMQAALDDAIAQWRAQDAGARP